MDQQNRVGSKFGGGGMASASETAMDRRERLRKLAMETIDLSKDPYILHTHLGTIECKLCLTMHTNEGSYLAHTQGKKHQTNLARRSAMDNAKAGNSSAFSMNTALPSSFSIGNANATQQLLIQAAAIPKKQFLKIGRPAYKITKVRSSPYSTSSSSSAVPSTSSTPQVGLLIQIQFDNIKDGVVPCKRFMSEYDPDAIKHKARQQIMNPTASTSSSSGQWQYLIVAAEPYETIAFKIPARQLSSSVSLGKNEDATAAEDASNWEHWDVDTKTWTKELLFA